jgi:hypothetical protein
MENKTDTLAERVRFELTEPVKVQRFSRPPHSTTLPPLRNLYQTSPVVPPTATSRNRLDPNYFSRGAT